MLRQNKEKSCNKSKFAFRFEIGEWLCSKPKFPQKKFNAALAPTALHNIHLLIFFMSQRRRLPTKSRMDAYTPFRTKYGYLDGYENSNKSGVTPTQHLFPGHLMDPKLETQIKHKEKIQQEALFGWTTRELADLDCLTIRDTKPGDLESLPIIPLLDRPVWERSSAPDFARTYMYVLKDSQGGGGFSAHNDSIWEVLKPALKIASVYLSSIYMLPFVIALTRINSLSAFANAS